MSKLIVNPAKLIAATLVAALTSCSQGPMTVTGAYSSQQCQLSTPGIFEVASEPKLKDMVASVISMNDAASQPKALDYDNHHILAVSLGPKPNSGYQLKLRDEPPVLTDQRLELPVEVITPATGQMYAQMMVSPCLIVSVPKGNYSSVTAAGMELTLSD